jgi:hypothetical protein
MSTILWQGRPIPFHPGDSVGTALARAGLRDLGLRATGGRHALFCGIGQCQNCLVRIAGRPVEACLAPCTEGLAVEPMEVSDAG